MNQAAPQFDELGRLLAALCDGALTVEESARLEQLAGASSEARRFALDYLLLNGELQWEAASGAGSLPRLPELVLARAQVSCDAPGGVFSLSRLRPPTSWTSRALAASALVVVACTGLLLAGFFWGVPWVRQDGGPAMADDAPPARITQTHRAVGFAADADLFEQADLDRAAWIDLREGLLELAFSRGARVVLQGPARLEIAGPNEARLESGSLVAHVPREASGFAVHTPTVSVIDRGTEFGVAVAPSGESRIRVFEGAVDIVPRTGLATGVSPNRVESGQAVRARTPVAGASLLFESIAAEDVSLVRTIPKPRALVSVTGLRSKVAERADLLHHYTFEGTTAAQRRRDKRGDLHLVETVMRGGRGRGSLSFLPSPLAPDDTVLRPSRGEFAGNTVGAALQSEHVFRPPETMTVEMLVCFTGFGGAGADPIGCAVATRADAARCGFLVVAVDSGQIACLLRGDVLWSGAEHGLVAGDWYYLASTFRSDARSRTTLVSTWVANLSREEETLTRLLDDERVEGTPAASRLGIGKGFDRGLAHAYPWAGMIDEVAIYRDALDEGVLQDHLGSLWGDVGNASSE